MAVERVRAGEAVRVTSEKTVRVGEGRTLEYDELVVAVGSEYPSGLKASCDPNEEDAEIGARAREMAKSTCARGENGSTDMRPSFVVVPFPTQVL